MRGGGRGWEEESLFEQSMFCFARRAMTRAFRDSVSLLGAAAVTKPSRVLGTVSLVSQGACDHGGLVLRVQPLVPAISFPAPSPGCSQFSSRMVNSTHYQGSNFIF